MNFPRFYSFWSINAPLNQLRLRRQLEQFRALGFDGVVWHPRFYPGEPPYLGDRYLAEVSDVILHAKSLGLAFWLYDEDGWPSGTVGGRLLKKYPNDAQRWVDLVAEKPEHCLAAFERNGRKWFLAGRIGRGVDYLNPDLVQHFMELTHERYHTGLKSEAWGHIEAIFCDEPEFGLGHAYDSLSRHGAIPWTPQLPEFFRQRFGEDLLPQISNLFFAGEGASATRVKFWELLTDVFNESFVSPLNDWCRRHGKLFTAHVKGEEHPLFQVPTNGSCHQFFRRLDLPGIDALERHPGNNFYPRQLSAAARQFGGGRCMAEVFGGAGWGAAPEELENYLLWLGRHGLTDFVLHLSQYRLDSAALRDWPPSQPLHLTWRDVYPEVLKHVRRELEKNPRPAADTLIVAPNRGVMANFQPREFLQTNVHNAATYPESAAGKINRRFLAQVEELHSAGVNYDLADERTLEQLGQVAAGKLAVGRCAYRSVILPEGCQLNEAARALVQSLPDGAPVFAPALIKAKTKLAGTVTGVPIPVRWKLEAHPLNALLLEPVQEPNGAFVAGFEISEALPDAALQLVFADDIASLTVNGQTLPLKISDEGSAAKLAGTEIHGTNTIGFRPARNVEHPFVWLKGFFRVHSRAAFVAGPDRTMKTEGAFILNPPRGTLDRDLVADGFPFLQTSLKASAEIELPDKILALRFDGVEADAIRLSVDGRDFGWTWRTNGEISFAANLAAGKHRFRIELVPSTFNGFGPHHYYLGDWHAVSPDQFKGVRNYADAPDAPAKTHVAAWHFRRFVLPAGICVHG